MLICEPRRIVSNVDRMAYDHLVRAGVIYPNKAGRPRSDKKVPKARIGWKRLNPTGWHPKGTMCDQCGASSGSENKLHPYGMRLCPDCFQVHAVSIDRGLRPTDEINW